MSLAVEIAFDPLNGCLGDAKSFLHFVNYVFLGVFHRSGRLVGACSFDIVGNDKVELLNCDFESDFTSRSMLSHVAALIAIHI